MDAELLANAVAVSFDGSVRGVKRLGNRFCGQTLANHFSDFNFPGSGLARSAPMLPFYLLFTTIILNLELQFFAHAIRKNSHVFNAIFCMQKFFWPL